MSNGNNNHKNRPYHFPAPLLIKSDSPITVTDGKATLVHEGNIVVRIVDGQFIELQPQDRTVMESAETISEVMLTHEPSEPVIPNDYGLLTGSRSQRATYGGERSVYEYYKRERDASYLVVIKRDQKIIRVHDLGSLFDLSSKIGMALKTFTREKPFYRRDLKPVLMPPSLKQGQLIKSCLDILVHEGFLEIQKIPMGEQQIVRYLRTQKVLP